MDPKEVDRFKRKLEAEKVRLLAELRALEEGNLGESQYEVSGENAYLDHMADAGTITFERERDLSLEQNIKDILDRVEKALKHIDRGTYGMCARCGAPIVVERLRALPYAELCIECKKKEEAGH